MKTENLTKALDMLSSGKEEKKGKKKGPMTIEIIEFIPLKKKDPEEEKEEMEEMEEGEECEYCEDGSCPMCKSGGSIPLMLQNMLKKRSKGDK